MQKVIMYTPGEWLLTDVNLFNCRCKWLVLVISFTPKTCLLLTFNMFIENIEKPGT